MKNFDNKQKILNAAWELLEETQDPNLVTVRRIAERAGVGIGLINYHFKSKDIMFMEATGEAMSKIANTWLSMSEVPGKSPKENLKNMLITLSDMGSDYMHIIVMAARFELLGGKIKTPLYILSFINQITGLDDTSGRLLAFSLISALQSAVQKPDEFRVYSGFDLRKKIERDKAIELLINSFFKGYDK